MVDDKDEGFDKNRKHHSSFIFKEFFITDPDWNHAKELVVIRRIRKSLTKQTILWLID